MLTTVSNFLKAKLLFCGSSAKITSSFLFKDMTSLTDSRWWKREKLFICSSNHYFHNSTRCRPLFFCLNREKIQIQFNRRETTGSVHSILNDKRLWSYVETLLNEYAGKTELGKSPSENNIRLLNLFHCMKELEETKKEMNELTGFIEDRPDKELVQLAKDDFETCCKKISSLEKQVLRLLIPCDPVDQSDVIMEISAGVGGQEAMLFAKELTDMYLKFIVQKPWKTEIMDWDETDLGGLRHAAISICGPGSFQCLKYEGGVHRVQRVPKTEKSGRIHTSTVAVAVSPQPSEIAIQLNPKDLKILTKRASGAGGQHVNTTESAVQIIHIPTGIMVESQTDRSQLQNKNQALKKLRAKLYDIELERIISQQKRKRKIQIGSSARSEKIRTYNFPQDRITDHRIGISLHNLSDFMLGSQLDRLIAKIAEAADHETLMELIEDNSVN